MLIIILKLYLPLYNFYVQKSLLFMNIQKYTTLTVLSATLLLLPAINIYPQSADQNYIVTKTYTSTTASNDVIQYYDGLGRPVQTVQKQFTPAGKDLVTRRDYDPFGREWKNWLPIYNGNTNGNYDNTTGVAAGYGNDAYAYSETKYEPSPLNRVDEQYGPGQVWRDNTRRVKTEYMTNTASGDLACVKYSMEDFYQFRRDGFYDAGQLYVTKITDEDNNVSCEFKDKLGRILLHRQIVDGVQYNTNYVYDDLGNLRVVLPPLASDAFATNQVYAPGLPTTISIYTSTFIITPTITGTGYLPCQHRRLMWKIMFMTEPTAL